YVRDPGPRHAADARGSSRPRPQGGPVRQVSERQRPTRRLREGRPSRTRRVGKASTTSAARFQTWWLVSGSRQSMTTGVWSAVRVVLPALPSALVSLQAAGAE